MVYRNQKNYSHTKIINRKHIIIHIRDINENNEETLEKIMD
jgi:hypothetical protein